MFAGSFGWKSRTMRSGKLSGFFNEDHSWTLIGLCITCSCRCWSSLDPKTLTTGSRRWPEWGWGRARRGSSWGPWAEWWRVFRSRGATNGRPGWWSSWKNLSSVSTCLVEGPLTEAEARASLLNSWYLRHGINATTGFYSISSIVSHAIGGKALPSFLEAPKNQALGRLVQLVGKVGRRWNDRQDQDNVRVGSVDEASADGVNHAQDGQEVERSVDGWATSARQELGGQPRADAEHQEGAKAVEDENLEKVGWCGSKVCSYLTASNKVFFNKILTKHQNYRVMVVLMPSLSSSSYIKSSRSMMEQL